MFDAVELALYLEALDRSEEAVDLLEEITGPVEFTGNYNIWTPVGTGLVVLSRLYKLAQDTKGRKQAIARVAEHGIYGGDHQEYFDERLNGHEGILLGASQDTQKWGCAKIAAQLMKLIYLRKAARADFRTRSPMRTRSLIRLSRNAWRPCDSGSIPMQPQRTSPPRGRAQGRRQRPKRSDRRICRFSTAESG